jgi:hypothetical protein
MAADPSVVNAMPWSDVHEKVISLSFDCAPLPWLLAEWASGKANHRPASNLEATRSASLDLLHAGAVVVGRCEFLGTVTREPSAAEAESVLLDDRAWTKDEGADHYFEVWPIEPRATDLWREMRIREGRPY